MGFLFILFDAQFDTTCNMLTL